MRIALVPATALNLRALCFSAGLGKGPLQDFIAFSLVVFRSDFQECLAHLCHATPFGRGDPFEGPFEI
jgi:hypothetical protein